jgi:protein-S-isoprenylcysteine O-methyltransferase Ste14
LVLGLALRAWSVIALGRNFTVHVQVRAEQPVVDTGPYRLLRHPSYTALLLVCLGIGVALANWLALIVIVVLPTAAILLRIRVEERALLAGIGEPYRRFAATRKRLIPWVW